MKRLLTITLGMPAVCLLLAGCFMDPSTGNGSKEPPSPTADPQPGSKTTAPGDDLPPDDNYPELTDEDIASLKPGELKPAPEKYGVKLETTEGDIIIEVNRKWSPNGADRFYELAQMGYYDGARFFRVLDGFMAQAGVHRDPRLHKHWMEATIPDDPTTALTPSNKPGYVTFAKSGLPNSRSTQFFINYGNNGFLDRDGFTPFGKVIEGMDVALKLHKDYGEGAPRGRGPSQGRIMEEGNVYLKADFPKLDYIKKVSLVDLPAEEDSAEEKTAEPADSEQADTEPAAETQELEAPVPAENTEN